ARCWTDREQQQARIELAKLTRKFREAEALAAIKGRDPTAQAISLMVGLDPKTPPLFHAFEVTEKERRQADQLAEQLFAAMKDRKSPSAIEYAA
ncbi:hypothetical protein, partial [Caulobacter sp. 602-1]|uniref:hypothetical protein n=1 Tax=Caulobacter sp. 602-1 TaxID=2492472 RepID=UPI0013159BAC